ncbi:MAG: cyclic nucleotide-binding domain-containing protein, partial [Chloroflexota bacterium]
MENHGQVKHSLSRLRHFAELPDNIKQTIGASAAHRHFNAGQVIYVEGEPAESVYILESGWVKATRMTREGREQAMMFLRPVEVFGDIAVLTNTTYPGTVVALEDVDVWVIPAQTVLDLIPRHPEF